MSVENEEKLSTSVENEEKPSTSEKKSLYCEICQVAFVTEETLKLHVEDEHHKWMEEYADGEKIYESLEAFIASPNRSEPVIGLQYIAQRNMDIKHPKAFKCCICEHNGNLPSMIKHITGYKHRVSYLAKCYSYMFPLFKRYQHFHVRDFRVCKHAKIIERKEAFSKKRVPEKEPEKGVLKNDFEKYTVELHKRLTARNKKLHLWFEQKTQVLEFLKTFVIESEEDEALVQKLKEDLQEANSVYRKYKEEHILIVKRNSKYTGSKKEKFPGKRKSIWDEEPSTTPCDKFTKETESKDKKTGTFSFPKGLWDEENKLSDKEHSMPSTSTSSVTDLTPACDDLAEVPGKEDQTAEKKQPSNANPLKRPWVARRKCTGYGSGLWTSVTNNSDQKASWGSKIPTPSSPSIFDSLNASPGKPEKDIEMAKKRRASADILSTFTLFSQSGNEQSSSLSYLSNPLLLKEQSSDQVKTMDHDFQELPSSSSSDLNMNSSKTPVIDDIPQIIKKSSPGHQDDCLETYPEELDLDSDLKYNPFNLDLESNPDDHIILDEYTDESAEVDVGNVQEKSMLDSDLNSSLPEESDLKDTPGEKCDGNDHSQPPHNVDSPSHDMELSNILHLKHGKKITPELLQHFKGKDVDVVVSILKALSPYYTEFQKCDLQELAKVLSETGTLG
ncbi:uncharacterized protein LOC134608799 [Pelobates fuscus]|uniref:uncharacterized protein LOC134608799 n=1 Tax=Pelobates fuscus TaxID=191477 RepID=UPI002FE4E599